jgi:CubicO group peptidase (beta-lactamase class C family)
MLTFVDATGVLLDAIDTQAFPAAVAEVGTATRPLWSESFGRLTFDADASHASEETIFDLASLTKVLATTPLIMQLVESGVVGLDDPVARHLGEWASHDRAAVTIRDLLSHCSGLAAYRPFYLRARSEQAVRHLIAGVPLAYPPRTRSVYSDLDFMLLGFILGGAPGLPRRLASLLTRAAVVDPLQFLPSEKWRHRTAPTARDVWRGRLLVGEVDDLNAWALGGVAGHAGLFGTAAAVGAVARHLLQILAGRVGVVAQSTLAEFIARRTDVPGSSRALGWDTMLPTSSCGTLMSPRAFGHTGFTGTSLWIDPDRGVYVVLLTNRVYPDRLNGAIAHIRPAFHDAVIAEIDRSGGT